MKVIITVEVKTKEDLIRELSNVVENISRFDRFDPIRKWKNGEITVSTEGSLPKFGVYDEVSKQYMSYHDTRQEANAVAGDYYSVIKL